MSIRALLIQLIPWAWSGALQAQGPWALDTTFRTRIDAINVNSILLEEDGGLILSGQMRFPGYTDIFRLAKVDSTGELDLDFNVSGLGGSTMTRWNDRFYVETSSTVRRILPTGQLDQGFIEMNAGPYFSSFQGGDYHVYPDGRVLLSGLHTLRDSIRGFEGLYNLMWFSNEGYLDTTRTHRSGNGTTDEIHQLPDGRFLVSGTQTTWEGVPVSKIFRVMPDGSLDPSFNSGINWGVARCFLPLPDGRVYLAGRFRRTGFPSDTLRIARLHPDGTLDESFRAPDMSYVNYPDGLNIGPGVSSIHLLSNGQLLCMGGFERVDGQVRKRICLLDSTGQLLPGFDGCGVDMFTYLDIPQGSLQGYQPTPDAKVYIWGAFHGYNDGTVNDTAQRMVTRLYGPDWPTAVREEEVPAGPAGFLLHPNPAQSQVTLSLSAEHVATHILLRDHLGRVVLGHPVGASSGQLVIDTSTLASGSYVVEVRTHDARLLVERLLIQ